MGVGFAGNGDRFLPGKSQMYEFDGTTWNTLGGELKGGYALALSNDGKAVAISDHKGVDNGEESGMTNVYEWDGSSWNSQGTQINGNAGGLSGTAVALAADGHRVVTSGPLYALGGLQNVGVTRVYDFC